MEFKVIPNKQTPTTCYFTYEIMTDYIEENRETLEAFLEFARTRGNAVGLAANQCSVSTSKRDDKRFMMRAFALGGKERKWRMIINPKITKNLGLKQMKAEGCLTWKGQTIMAERYEGVEVSYYDMDGVFHEKEVYKGFDAQIWQHEINHLNGVEEDVHRGFLDSPPPIVVGRNEPCPCGSGKKYKKCCLLF